MWHHMFALPLPIGEKLLRTVLVYALIAILIRLTGKRGLAGLNTLDIVVVILLSNVVQNAIIGDDLSVTGGVIGAVALVLVDQALNQLSLRVPWVERIFDGTATTLIAHGEPNWSAVHRVGLSKADLAHAVRLQNGDTLGQVETAQIESGGQLIVTLRPDEQSATKADVEALRAQLARIEAALAIPRTS